MPDNNGFYVGDGVDNALRKNKDKAKDIERYVTEYLSVTPGEKGLYWWHGIGEVLVFIPKWEGQ